MKKIVVASVIVLVLGGSVFAYFRWQRLQKEDVPPAVEISQIERKSAKNPENTTLTGSSPSEVSSLGTSSEISLRSPDSSFDSSAQTTIILPESLNLKMYFYPQAPFGNWDYPWQEACEEASVLLVANTYFGHGWTREEFNEQILKLVEWEKAQFGAYEHTTVAQTAQILNDYLHLQTKIHENPTFEDIQNILAKGHLTVMTFAGKQIGNPYYKNGGPNYHAMVIKGYKEGEKLITEDVGTKRGEDYVYRWKTLQHALHDYAEPIDRGAKRMIEVIPPTK